MKHHIFRKAFSLVTSIVVLVSAVSVSAAAKTAKYSDPKPLPKLTGDYRKDFVAVAKSQLGYSEASDNSSYFGAWNGDPYQNWCSEFVSWCAEKTEMPFWISPRLCSVHRYRDYFAVRGMCYYLEGGVDPKKYDYLKDYDNIEYISPTELKPGDIIVENSGDVFYNPNHVAIFLDYKGGMIEVIDGNCGNRVRQHTIELKEVYCVSCPDYEQKNPVSAKDINDIEHWAVKYPITAVYSGKNVVPDIKIYDKELNYYLKEGKDYTVKTENAVKVGNATAVYKGKGVYTGSFTIDYKVVKPTITLTYDEPKDSTIKLHWNKIDGAERYIIYRSEDGGKKFKKVITKDENSTYSVLTFNKNKTYTYYIKARVKPKNGNAYYIQSDKITVGKDASKINKSTFIDDEKVIIIIYPDS